MRKSKQKFTLTQIAMIFGAIGAVGGTANAQWAVTNVNDAVYFGPTGLFTQMMAHMTNSAKAATDQNTALNELNRKQNAQLVEDADQRARMAAGQAEIAKKLSAIRPTLDACGLASENLAKTEAAATSARGSSGGGGQPARKVNPGRAANLDSPTQNPKNLLDGPKTDIEANAIILETRKKLDTCSAKEVADGFQGCKGAGGEHKFSGTEMILASDISPLSLFGNTNNKLKTDKSSEFANRSITIDPDDPDKTLEVSRAYMNNLLTTRMPKTLDTEKLLQSPDLMAQYRILQLRLESSFKPLRDILNLTIAPKILSPGVAKDYWTKQSGKYQALLGTKAPTVPSVRDLLLFQVSNDYMGVPDSIPANGDEVLKAMNQKMAVSNYLSYKQLEAIENLNVQLAVINANQLTPFDFKAYSQEINKIDVKRK